MERSAQPGLIHLDTHVVAWLHDGLVEKLSPAAVAAIETGRLRISPLVELELGYLREIGRIRPTPGEIVAALASDIGLERSTVPLAGIVTAALALDWTRDPFDRLIVAEAIVAGARLVTRDERIRAHAACACW